MVTGRSLLEAFDRLEKFYDFKDINQAIADSRSGVSIKPVLRFKKG